MNYKTKKMIKSSTPVFLILGAIAAFIGWKNKEKLKAIFAKKQ